MASTRTCALCFLRDVVVAFNAGAGQLAFAAGTTCNESFDAGRPHIR